ncbi:MAG: hypothetical protein ACJ71W_16110 [Terriglobales bacterium]
MADLIPLLLELTIPWVPHPLPLLQRVGFHTANTTTCLSERPNHIAATTLWNARTPHRVEQAFMPAVRLL